MRPIFASAAAALLVALSFAPHIAAAQKHGAAPPKGYAAPAPQASTGPPTPEQRMSRRYPQPVRTGYLIGLPVQDEKDRIIGHVDRVVRTGENKIKLIVPYSAQHGWAKSFPFVKKRPVAVPIETVVILGAHLNALEFTRADFEKAPVWMQGEGSPVPAGETIRVALGSR